MGGKSDAQNSSMMSILNDDINETSTSDLPNSEQQKRNEAIFRNLTFDQEGNPLHMHIPDPDKLIP